jgi:hypothetical protein
MPLTRRVDLFLDNQRIPGNVLLTSLSDPTAPSTPAWIEDDKFLVRLRFCDRPAAVGGSATPIELPVDNVIAVAGKKTRGAGAALFTASNFTKVVVPASGEVAFDCYYQAVLNLNTVPMSSAFGSESQITVYVDVEIQAPASDGGDDPDRITYQFPVTIVRQSYDSAEAATAPGGPVYPAPELLALRQPVNGAYRIVSDGAAGLLLQLKNGTTGKFHTVFVTGAEGAEVLTIGPGVV